MAQTSHSPQTPDSTAANVLPLGALRHRFPRRNRPHRPLTQAEAGHSYPCIYIFPVWSALRDSVGG